jgi:hypothetical protein
MRTALRVAAAAMAAAALVFSALATGQSSQLVNISTRSSVRTGDEVMIAGFIIQGASQRVVVRARGPSLVSQGVPGALSDPVMSLIRMSDSATIASSDNWGSAPNAAELASSGFAPSHPNEAAILMTLTPGAYTAIVSGVGGGTGIAIVEVFAAPEQTPAGAYTGTDGSGLTVLALVTGTGKYYVMHSPAAYPWAVSGLDWAPSATATAGTLTSNTEKSISPLEYVTTSLVAYSSATVRLGSLAATYVQGTSLAGTFSYLPSGSLTIDTAFVAGSHLPASLSVFPASYNGKGSYSNIGMTYSRFDWAPVGSVTVSGSGALTGTFNCHLYPLSPTGTPSCGISGTLTPRSDMKAYDVTFSLVEVDGGKVPFQLQGKTFSGLAFLDADTGKFTLVGVATDNNVFIFSN